MAKKDYTNWDRNDLIEEIEELRKRKKYGLVWEDKPEVVVEQCKKELPVLEEVEEKEISTDPNKPTNLLIEGDNFHTLSVLNYTHNGKIDVIYIDPPYNTGAKDFIYNDRYVDVEDGYRHSKWLSFMSKRLKLARMLLKNDGLILISIDDNEQAQLKVLCDEIFGENNRLSIHHIQVRYTGKTLNEKNDWQPVMEYVLVYAKNSSHFRANKPTSEYSIDKFIYEMKEQSEGIEIVVKNRKVRIFRKGEWKLIKHKIPDTKLLKETWVSGSIYSGTGNGKMVQNVIEPRIEIDGYGSLYKIYGLGEDGLGYRYFTGPQREGANRSKMFTGIPIIKSKEMETGDALRYQSIPNYYDFSPDFGNIRHEGGVGFNSGKKPVKLLKQLINYHKNNNAFVLDFFSGSGSTGHAVLELNNDDDGNRTFILATNNESSVGGEKIAEDICYPRIRNVIEGKNGRRLGGNLKYFKTSFVPADSTDKNKIALTNKATEMLCIKEGTFEEVKSTGKYKIFHNNKHHTGIIFDHLAISEFKKEIKEIDGKFSVYVFSLGDDTFDEEFEDIKNKVKLSPIPEAILRVYRRIFK